MLQVMARKEQLGRMQFRALTFSTSPKDKCLNDQVNSYKRNNMLRERENKTLMLFGTILLISQASAENIVALLQNQ